MPSCAIGAAPESSSTGLSEARALIERPERVGKARGGGHERNAHLPGQLGEGVRHEHRGGLVAGVDDLDPGIDAGIEDRHDLVAGQAEDAPHAGLRQRLHQDVRAPHAAPPFLPGSRRHPDHRRPALSTGPPPW